MWSTALHRAARSGRLGLAGQASALRAAKSAASASLASFLDNRCWAVPCRDGRRSTGVRRCASPRRGG
eukprot:6955958-Lingulodinium_polyedra.AAC.1